MLALLNFIGKLAVIECADTTMLDMMRSHRDEYKHWVWSFIHRVTTDKSLVTRAQQKFNI